MKKCVFQNVMQLLLLRHLQCLLKPKTPRHFSHKHLTEGTGASEAGLILVLFSCVCKSFTFVCVRFSVKYVNGFVCVCERPFYSAVSMRTLFCKLFSCVCERIIFLLYVGVFQLYMYHCMYMYMYKLFTCMCARFSV